MNLISDNTTRNSISNCMPASSGNLIAAFKGNAVTSLNYLSATITGIGHFNVTYQVSMMLSNMIQVTSQVSNFQGSIVADLADPSSI
jgi:hypothetical protein